MLRLHYNPSVTALPCHLPLPKGGCGACVTVRQIPVCRTQYIKKLWRTQPRKKKHLLSWQSNELFSMAGYFVKYFAFAKCEIIGCFFTAPLWNFPLRGKWNEINPSRAAAHFTRRRRISRAKQISQIPQGIYFVEKKQPLSGRQRLFLFWRRGRDSNPRDAFNAYTISSRAPSASSATSPIQPILLSQNQLEYHTW